MITGSGPTLNYGTTEALHINGAASNEYYLLFCICGHDHHR